MGVKVEMPNYFYHTTTYQGAIQELAITLIYAEPEQQQSCYQHRISEITHDQTTDMVTIKSALAYAFDWSLALLLSRTCKDRPVTVAWSEPLNDWWGHVTFLNGEAIDEQKCQESVCRDWSRESGVMRTKWSTADCDLDLCGLPECRGKGGDWCVTKETPLERLHFSLKAEECDGSTEDCAPQQEDNESRAGSVTEGEETMKNDDRLPKDVFYTKLVGVDKGGFQPDLRRFKEVGGGELDIVPENNPYDRHACGVWWLEDGIHGDTVRRTQLGYLSMKEGHSAVAFGLIIRGCDLRIEAQEVTGGTAGKKFGLNVGIYSPDEDIRPHFFSGNPKWKPKTKPKDDPDSYTQPIF